MARYILIDNNTGYIFGDTADFASGRQSEINSICDAARMLDESIGASRFCIERGRNELHASVEGYHVYRADIDGGEAVPVVVDGQDQETIEEVERLCSYEGFVECQGHDETEEPGDFYEVIRCDPESGSTLSRRIIKADSIEEACELAGCFGPEKQDIDGWPTASNHEGTIMVTQIPS